jgi:hypothetical protein
VCSAHAGHTHGLSCQGFVPTHKAHHTKPRRLGRERYVQIMKKIVYILFVILLFNCSCGEHNGDEYYSFKTKTPLGMDIDELKIGVDGYFSYKYLRNMENEKRGIIHGTWRKNKDSLLLKIIYPVDYKIKKSFVSYSNYKSSDSIYIFIYNLYPEIVGINYIYHEVSISLIENCMTDTCPSREFVNLNNGFGDTIVIPRNYSRKPVIETMTFFDPNDKLVDKSILVKFGKDNCIKVYLARKPNFDFIEIPLRFVLNNRRLYYTDVHKTKRYFVKTRD